MKENHNSLTPPFETPDFITVFDGGQPQLTTAEKLAAGAKFQSLVDDLLLTHIDRVDNANPHNPRWAFDRLLLTVSMVTGSCVANVTKRKLESREEHAVAPHQLPDNTIGLQFIDKEGRERTSHLYGLGSDGVVRRQDLGDIFLEDEEEKQLRDEGLLKDPEPIQLTKEFFDAVLENAAINDGGDNEDLEMAMGLNNQPVGLHEVEGLGELLQAAE